MRINLNISFLSIYTFQNDCFASSLVLHNDRLSTCCTLQLVKQVTTSQLANHGELTILVYLCIIVCNRGWSATGVDAVEFLLELARNLAWVEELHTQVGLKLILGIKRNLGIREDLTHNIERQIGSNNVNDTGILIFVTIDQYFELG